MEVNRTELFSVLSVGLLYILTDNVNIGLGRLIKILKAKINLYYAVVRF